MEKSNEFRFPLDIQTFGEGEPGGEPGTAGSQTSTPPATAAAATGSPEVDYDRLADVVAKRSSGTEDKVLQGYFKSQGLSQEEATQAIQAFKETKATKAKEERERYQNIIKENERLKAEKTNADIDNQLSTLAIADSVPAEKLPFLMKMVDRKDLVKEDGTLDEDKIKSSYEAVLKAFPEFKNKSEGSNGFQQIGGSSGTGNNATADAQLDAIFGIKK